MKNLTDLTGKVAVVLGGGGGIGGSIAKGFAFYGADVVISGRTMETLEAMAAQIKEEVGKDVTCITADATDYASLVSLKDQVLEKFGTVDILVNSQGRNIKFPVLDLEEHLDDWDAVYKGNVKSIVQSCSIFGKIMAEKKYGKIINVSSIRGARAIKAPGNAAYGSSKGAVDMLTKYLAGEWGPHNITVNAIAPIVTMTPMMLKLGPPPPGTEEKFQREVPLGRWGDPDDNIGPALFYASDLSSFVTGQITYTDGGLFCVGS